MRPPRAACVIGTCPGIFSKKLGSGIGQFSDQPRWLQQHKQGQEERSKGECGHVEGTEESGQPPGMLPLRSWCSPACTSSAQLLHMEKAMQLATCAAGCVRAQHALGSSVPRRSCMGVGTLRTCVHYPCLMCTNLERYQVTSFQAWQSSKDDEKLVNPKMRCTPCSIYHHRSINLLLNWAIKSK